MLRRFGESVVLNSLKACKVYLINRDNAYIAIDAIGAAKNRTEKDHLEFRAAAAILHGNGSPLQNPRQFL
jgi:hypothetical protein